MTQTFDGKKVANLGYRACFASISLYHGKVHTRIMVRLMLAFSFMNPLFPIKLAFLAVMFCGCASARAEEIAQPVAGAPPSVVVKVEKAIGRGAKAAASGIKKGVTAGAHGVERGAHAATSGVERGAKAAARGIERGATATARAAKTVSRKVGASPASSSVASH